VAATCSAVAVDSMVAEMRVLRHCERTSGWLWCASARCGALWMDDFWFDCRATLLERWHHLVVRCAERGYVGLHELIAMG